MITQPPGIGGVYIDGNGIKMPWYTFGVLEILDKMDLMDKYVWEYGEGYSTKWYESRWAITFGVDSEEKWRDFAGGYCYKEKKEYLGCINNGHWEYDLIVIDGEWRDDCIAYAFPKIKRGGIIIIDNWMQPSVPPNEWFRTLDLLATKKLKHKSYPQEGHPDWSTLIIQC